MLLIAIKEDEATIWIIWWDLLLGGIGAANFFFHYASAAFEMIFFLKMRIIIIIRSEMSNTCHGKKSLRRDGFRQTSTTTTADDKTPIRQNVENGFLWRIFRNFPRLTRPSWHSGQSGWAPHSIKSSNHTYR